MEPVGNREKGSNLIYFEPSTQRDLSKVRELFHNYFSKIGFAEVPKEKLYISEKCSARYGQGGAAPDNCPELVPPSCFEKDQILEISNSKPFRLRRVVCIGMLRMPVGLVFEDIDNAYPSKGMAIPTQKLTADSLRDFQLFKKTAQQEWVSFFRELETGISSKKLEWVRISRWFPESKNFKGENFDVTDRVAD